MKFNIEDSDPSAEDVTMTIAAYKTPSETVDTANP